MSFFIIFFWFAIFSRAYHSPLEVRSTEFTLIMRSGEVIYRYSFYGGFWLKLARYLGTPMNQSFVFNSIFLPTEILASLINPSMALKQEEQYVETFALPGQYMSLFQETTISKICCLHNMYNPLLETPCQPSSFDNPNLYKKLVVNNHTVPYKIHNFTGQTYINDAFF